MRRMGLVLAFALAGCGTDASEAVAVENTTQRSPAPTGTGAAAPAGTPSAPAAEAPDAGATLPADVVAFRTRRDECDHFRGEEATDADRAAFLGEALERSCKGSDAELKALRVRYAGDAAATAALADYEDEIE